MTQEMTPKQFEKAAEGRTIAEVAISAIVTRCGCGDPENVHPRNEDGSMGPCPTPRATEDHGVISYYHRNPLRRLWWNIKQAWHTGWST